MTDVLWFKYAQHGQDSQIDVDVAVLARMAENCTDADFQIEGFSADYETLALDWRGVALSIQFCADCCRSWREIYGSCLCLIRVSSSSGQPLSIGETGSRSFLVSAEILTEWRGPLPYVVAMLDEEAKRPEWLSHRQLSLF